MHNVRIIKNNKPQKATETTDSVKNQSLYTTSSTSSYFGARYLDPRTSRWLSVDPAMYQGDYIPGAPINDEVRRNNNNLPGMGGIYNYVNMHVYHYGANNPVVYRDPNGRVIRNIIPFFRMNEGRWAVNDHFINNSSILMRSMGCAITGLANVISTWFKNISGVSGPDGLGTPLITPADLNISNNFTEGTIRLNWYNASMQHGMSVVNFVSDNSLVAQNLILDANSSANSYFVLAQLDINITNDTVEHWIGIDGPLVDLNRNGNLWLRVSPTSSNDSSNRISLNSNWQLGTDGSLYVRLDSIKGAVIIE